MLADDAPLEDLVGVEEVDKTHEGPQLLLINPDVKRLHPSILLHLFATPVLEKIAEKHLYLKIWAVYLVALPMKSEA